MTQARLKQTLDAFFRRRMEEDHIPGIDCSVCHHHREIYRFQEGFADRDAKIPITEHTLYNIYSNTKVITCTAALQLYEQGYFLLDDPVSRYFPAMAQLSVSTEDGGTVPAQRTMTIRDLFRMTSGIAGGGDASVGRQFYEETGGACPTVLLPDYIARVPLRFEPGTDYCYGISHEVLAALIEKITGMTFGAYLKQNIFTPLGMNNTAFDLSDCTSGQLAMQYEVQGDGQIPRAIGAKNCLIPPILRESASGGLIS
ncbi:MAG: beta-lactamase family protein, partial [Clostridia bacterium]|nr:beta-lactamase family protein [Clostridia bacterium]